MGVTAQLQVDAVCLGLLEVEWLVIEQNDVFVGGYVLQELIKAFALAVAAVVPTHDDHACNALGLVPQEADAVFPDEIY